MRRPFLDSDTAPYHRFLDESKKMLPVPRSARLEGCLGCGILWLRSDRVLRDEGFEVRPFDAGSACDLDDGEFTIGDEVIDCSTAALQIVHHLANREKGRRRRVCYRAGYGCRPGCLGRRACFWAIIKHIGLVRLRPQTQTAPYGPDPVTFVTNSVDCEKTGETRAALWFFAMRASSVTNCACYGRLARIESARVTFYDCGMTKRNSVKAPRVRHIDGNTVPFNPNLAADLLSLNSLDHVIDSLAFLDSSDEAYGVS